MSTSTCGHTFCLACISEALSHTPQCPVDRSSLRSHDLKPAHAIIRNLVDELLVECPNKYKGCMETPQRHIVDIHTRDMCGYTAVPCPSAKCRSMPLRKDLTDHQLSCDRRSIQCPACKQSIPLADAETHAGECPRGVTSCLDCGIQFPREDLSVHCDACPLATVLCPHASFGCSWVGIREDLQQLPSQPDQVPSLDHNFHLTTCPYEALKGFFSLHATQNASLRAENTALREEICTLRSGLRDLEDDVGRAKVALGPWFRPESQQNDQSHNLPSSSRQTHHNQSQSVGLLPQQPSERIPMRRRLSSPFTSGVLGFPDPPRETEASSSSVASISTDNTLSGLPASPPRGELSSPVFGTGRPGHAGATLSFGSNPLPTLLIQDFPRHSQTPIPPVDVSGSLVGSLEGLRGSVARVAGEVDGVGRRLDMQFTTEMLRMHEEVASLRATVHGLRMQVHTFMNSNLMNGAGGIGYTQYGAGDSATVQYVNQSPPPSTVISIAGTVTHRRVAENKL
ncbi:hypothetical protein M408DRAFT_328557 [Serendipita vermifera MAFF 305830]|uniref:RING-type domain-containing protein n=1 Tax=Serendipita vermifera MAFF 305830 TaxID=933852 RepID=A0A0C2WU69_SERVB|nr:hypothetical protein M408DRAFT_328557 [Serendipita vermifera MAFF 305830]